MARATAKMFATKPSTDRRPEATIKNRDGYPAFERSLEEQYLQTLMTNTLGNTFYADQKQLLKESLVLHKLMLAKDPEYMAKAIVYARNHGYMRTQPVVGLAHLSTLPDKQWFKAAFNQVILTPDDLIDLMAVLGDLRTGRVGLGRSVKGAINRWLNNLSEYHAIKYGSTASEGWSLGDIIRATHPIPKDAKQDALFTYLVYQVTKKVEACPTTEKMNLLPQVQIFEQLKQTTDQAEARRLIEAGRIPHEVATGAVTKPDKLTWEYIMKQMPYFALLRNLATLGNQGVLNDTQNVQYVCQKLTDATAIGKVKVLPFRFLKALEKVPNARIGDAIRQALELSFANLPEIKGSTAVFLDVSGSMSGQYLDIGSIFATALYKKNRNTTQFLLFDHMLHDPQVSAMDTLMTSAEKVKRIGHGSTNVGLTIQHLLGTVRSVTQRSTWGYGGEGYAPNFPAAAKNTRPVKVDNIILITDEQQNHGSMALSEFTRYRKEVNPNAKLFVVDVAPYRSAMAPNGEPGVFFIYGWSDQVLQYISWEAEGYGGQVQAVRNLNMGQSL